MSFFIPSKSESSTLDYVNKFLILEANVEISKPPISLSSSASFLYKGKWDKFLFPNMFKNAQYVGEIHSHSQTDFRHFDCYLNDLY
jgi:hypothetical protein